MSVTAELRESATLSALYALTLERFAKKGITYGKYIRYLVGTYRKYKDRAYQYVGVRRSRKVIAVNAVKKNGVVGYRKICT